MSTKYPIILVHGMMVKDLFFLHSFGKIDKILNKNGYVTFITHQDGIGSIETNANQLKEEINEILKKTNTKKVNLIAHSKGGVDARFMINNLDMSDKVASLTTLSTPHKGSGFSSFMLKWPLFILKIINWFFNLVYRIFGDKKPNMFQCGIDLSKKNMEEFNKNNPDIEGIYYQSYSSSLSERKHDFISYIPHHFTKFCAKSDTDGLVEIESAKWTNYKGNVSEDLSHFELVDLTPSKKKKEKVNNFYLDLAKDLEKRGL